MITELIPKHDMEILQAIPHKGTKFFVLECGYRHARLLIRSKHGHELIKLEPARFIDPFDTISVDRMVQVEYATGRIQLHSEEFGIFEGVIPNIERFFLSVPPNDRFDRRFLIPMIED